MVVPKGYLVAIGGAEDKGQDKEKAEGRELDFIKEGVLQDIVSLMKGKDPVIEVLTTATSSPKESFKDYTRAFSKLGCTKVAHLDVRGRETAGDKKFIERLQKCNGVMITGGDQAKLSSILGGTPIIEILMKRYYSDHLVIAGTSAGAACMSGTMMNGGSAERGNRKGEVHLSIGLGFINELIIDTHFDARGRFDRLAQAIAMQPGIIGVGLGEDTGIIIEKGQYIQAIGSSTVTIIDGIDISYNNISEVKESMPYSLSKLQVYLLTHSDCYDLSKREFKPTKFDKMEE